jgi:hypothetical protein
MTTPRAASDLTPRHERGGRTHHSPTSVSRRRGLGSFCPCPNIFLSVVTLAEIELDISTASDPDRRAAFERMLADIRHEYRDRIAPSGNQRLLLT